MWTREDDLTHGFYRPTTYNVFRARARRLGQADRLVHARRRARASCARRAGVPAGQVDNASMAALRDLPYDIPNVRIEWVNKDFGVPIGFWRSVGSVAERVHRRELHRRAGAPGRPGPLRVPPRAPRQVAAPQGGPRAGRDQGQLGHAAPGGTGARHRGVLLLRELRRPRGRGLGRRRRRRPGPPARLRDRLRDRGQPGPGQGADGGRRRLRADGDALRPDHARRRAASSRPTSTPTRCCGSPRRR